MSRREREQRIKAAAPRREAYLAQQAATAVPARRPRNRTGLWFGLAVAVAAVGAVAYALVIQPWLDRRQLLHQAGQPRGAVFGDGVVALIDNVDVERRHRDDPRRDRRIDRTRVTVLDLAGGTQVAQHLFEGDGGCVAASPGRLWCDLGALAVHDARTFARLATFADVAARAGLGPLVARRWTVDGATATQLLDDGRAAVVDAATLAARVDERVPAALRPDPVTDLPPLDATLPRPAGCAAAHTALDRGAASLRVGDTTWTIDDATGPRARVRRTGAPPPPETFLAPTLLAAHDGAPLIVHHAAVDPARDHARVSRLRPDGSAAWTAELRQVCMAWRLDGASLIVATDAPTERAVAIDVVTGAIRWRAAF